MSIPTVDQELSVFMNISGFGMNDVLLLNQAGKFIHPYLKQLTDAFYQRLRMEPVTAAILEGRDDQLKKIHIAWLWELFNIQDIQSFIQSQEQVGQVQVDAKVPPLLVAACMSWLRSTFPSLIAFIFPDAQQVVTVNQAILRTLDISHYLIEKSYSTAMNASQKKQLTGYLGINNRLLDRLMSS